MGYSISNPRKVTEDQPKPEHEEILLTLQSGLPRSVVYKLNLDIFFVELTKYFFKDFQNNRG